MKKVLYPVIVLLGISSIVFGGCSKKNTEKTVSAEIQKAVPESKKETYVYDTEAYKERIGRKEDFGIRGDKVSVFDFRKEYFEILGVENYKGNNFSYLRYNGEYEIPIKPEIFCDSCVITKKSDTLFEIKLFEVDAEEVYTFDTETKELTFISRETDMHVH